MKLAYHLRKLKLVLFSALTLGSFAGAMEYNDYVYTGGGELLSTATNWRDLATGNTVTESWTNTWKDANQSNIINFVSSEDYSSASYFPTETLGSTQQISADFGDWYLGGIVVAEGAVGYSITSNASFDRTLTLLGSDASGVSLFDINENFSFSINTSSVNSDGRNMNLGSVDAVMDIARDKTFTFTGTLAGSADRTLTVQGGGTLDYNYNNGTTHATQANFVWEVSGTGSTLDLSSIANAQLDLAVGAGSVTLNDAGTLSLAADASFSAELHVGAAGGIINVAGSAGSSFSTGDISIAEGAGLTISTGDTLVMGGMSIQSSDASSSYVIQASKASGATISNTEMSQVQLTGAELSLTGVYTISDSDLTGATLSVSSGSTLTLNNVLIDSTINVEAGGNLIVESSTLTSLTVVDSGSISFETAQHTSVENVQSYTISGIDTLLQGTIASGTLTLDLGTIAGFTSPAESREIVAFTLSDISDLNDIIEGGYYNNIVVKIGDQYFSAQGAVMNGDDVMIYIPEPSTATLSLAALLGLLVRRRRRAA